MFIKQPEIKLRAELTKASTKPRGAMVLPVEPFEGDGVTTAFKLKRGSKPYIVLAPSFQLEGTAEAYTFTNDGFFYSVVFAVAPANGVAIGIIPVEGDL